MKEQELKEIERLRKAIENAKEYDEQSVSVRIDLLESFFSTIEAQREENRELSHEVDSKTKLLTSWMNGYMKLEQKYNDQAKELERLNALIHVLRKDNNMLESTASEMELERDYFKEEVEQLREQLNKAVEGLEKVKSMGALMGNNPYFHVANNTLSLLQGKEQNQTDTEPMD